MGAKGRQSSISTSRWRRLKKKSRIAQEEALEKERASGEARSCASEEVPGGQSAAGNHPAKTFTVKGDGIPSPLTSAGEQHSLIFKPSVVNEVESVRAAFERHGIVFGCPDEPSEVSPLNVPHQPTMNKEYLQPYDEHYMPPSVPHPPFFGGGDNFYGYLPDMPQSTHVDLHAPCFPASGHHSLPHQVAPLSQSIPPVAPFPSINSYTTGYSPILAPLDYCHFHPPFFPDPLTLQSHQGMLKKLAPVYSPILKPGELTASRIMNASESREHSDVNLTLYSCTGVFAPISHSVHRIIASRSRRLHSLSPFVLWWTILPWVLNSTNQAARPFACLTLSQGHPIYLYFYSPSHSINYGNYSNICGFRGS